MYIIATNNVSNEGFNISTEITKLDEYNISGTSRDGLVNWLKETLNWSKYAEGINGAVATGGPTLEQFWLSYNNKYLTNYSEERQELSEHEGYNNTLYFPYKEAYNTLENYILASSCSSNIEYVEYVGYEGGYVTGWYYHGCYRNTPFSMFTI